MRHPRTIVVLLLIALGTFGAWLGVRAQERHTEWPAPPSSVVVQAVEQRMPIGAAPGQPSVLSATQVKIDNSPMPAPAVLPASVTATEPLEPSAAEANAPPKLPAEIPAQPRKLEANIIPSPSAPPLPEPVKFPDLSESPPIPPPTAAKPSVPTEVETPKKVPAAPSLPQQAEPLHSPRVKDDGPIIAPGPAFPDIPKVEASPETSAADNTTSKPAPPATDQSAPPVPAPAAPMQIKQPIEVPAAVSQSPVVAPPPDLISPPGTEIKQPAIPVAPPPIVHPAAPEKKQPQTPSRPPAFLLVKPRRIEPRPAPPSPPVDGPRHVETPLASSAAHVTVEKRGPSVLRQGASAEYVVIVRNRGAAPSAPLTVVDEIPPLGRLLGGEPAPVQHGDKAIWTLPSLPANSETILKLELEATGSGDFVGNTTVFVSTASATTRAKIERDPEATAVSAGPLGIAVRGPVGGAVGQPVVFEVQVTNRGKQWLSNLVLHGKMSEGLSHSSGNNIEADIEDLAPGVSKIYKMPTIATRSGRQSIEVRITAAGGAEAKAQAFVVIAAGGLSIQTPPTSRLPLDRDGDLRIEVTNLQAQDLRNVVIADRVPDNLQFVAASDRGIYQAATRTVQWLIDVLPAGEMRTVTLRLRGEAPGQFAREVRARADSQPELRAQSLVIVEGYADLTLKVTPRDQPLEFGKETVCEVRVQNLGSGSATGVQLQLALPSGLAPGFVQGPTSHRMQGRSLVFEPIAQLAPGMQAVYHVGMRAQAAGEWRLRAQAQSDQARAPVTREVPLMVYRD